MEGSIITCANPTCPLEAADSQSHLSCKGCLLVKYCGRDCQVQHWGEHKKYCKSPLMKAGWKPEWATTGRTPEFVGDSGPSQVVFGGNKYLWGNVPAIDVLQLAKNEGSTYDQDVHLLFAASGDLRNVVKTVASIPEAFQKSVSIVLNDRDPEIVIRNAVLLLVSLTAEETKEAVDCMIHILYSAFIQENHLSILQGRIRVLVADVVQKIVDKPVKSLQAKAWSFGSRNLRLVLTKEIWCQLLERLNVPISLTSQKAHDVRTAITLAPSRKDYRERRYMCLLPAHRLSQERYRTDGLLLPFGASRAQFVIPNPTLFESNQSWPLKDSSDPLEGWNIFDILNKTPRAAPSDVYGKLYFYLQHAFKAFIEKSISLSASFQLFNVDAEDLSKHLERGTFSRIENTVVEKWPMRLKKKAGQPGAQEEFDLLFGSGHGNERYVEWQTVE
ncbi:uncharacterized protein TrAtP1_010132 [Trichoderma atroviride]|uniref:uncharacterized protein n=1 Tax=Hypocrea atroviridis TaxID=63577 RepID=UPI00332047AE|nr:hypothetical protein TrAtP1_010132 [Trichoderma atroviride]